MASFRVGSRGGAPPLSAFPPPLLLLQLFSHYLPLNPSPPLRSRSLSPPSLPTLSSLFFPPAYDRKPRRAEQNTHTHPLARLPAVASLWMLWHPPGGASPRRGGGGREARGRCTTGPERQQDSQRPTLTSKHQLLR